MFYSDDNASVCFGSNDIYRLIEKKTIHLVLYSGALFPRGTDGREHAEPHPPQPHPNIAKARLCSVQIGPNPPLCALHSPHCSEATLQLV